jgi:signal transduction histidine kinase
MLAGEARIPETGSSVPSRLVHHVSRAAAAAVAVTGLAVLVGWALDLGALESLLPGLATMKANTAAGLLLAASALWLLARPPERAGPWRTRAGRAIAAATAALALLTLAEYALDWSPGIDQLLFADLAPGTLSSPPGRMSPATAACFLLVAFALLLLDAPGKAPADLPAASAGLIALVAVVGYAYDVRSLYRVGPFSSMAFHTAAAFGLLSLGTLAARPERGLAAALSSPQPGGAMARRLLLPAVVLPAVLGWLALRGAEADLYNTQFALALVAVSLSVVFVVLVTRAARSLDDADTERRRFEHAEVRVRDLEEQNREALEAAQLKSNFVANMSHELRTPLNAIIGFTELITDGTAGPLSDQQKEFLNHALTSSVRLRQLIDDILDLARIEAGKMQLQPAAFEPGAAAREVEEIVLPLAKRKQIEIQMEADPGLGEVVADVLRFKQVLYNYLSNALKFTPDQGRITIRLRAEDPACFRLEVEDTGIGIAAEDHGRLFQSFYQLDNGLGKQHEGAGLGLALTRRLVEIQGGRVGVESTPGGGSLFFAILPRKPAAEAGSEQRPL